MMGVELEKLVEVCTQNGIKKFSNGPNGIEIEFFAAAAPKDVISTKVIDYPTTPNAVNLTTELIPKDNPFR
jgi:hypothetical protein